MTGSRLWEMYEALLALMPEGLAVEAYLAGRHWNLVRSSNVGMAMTPREGRDGLPMAGRVAGMRVTDVAACIKSWNNHEAALGLATINSVVNDRRRIESLEDVAIETESNLNLFDYMLDEVRGKRVAVVGHFRGLEAMAAACSLTILERLPSDGDLPDPACEYVLPDQDYVFITGTTLINKTLPRLLELCRGATVALVGPSTPMTPILFDYGIDILAGTVIVDGEQVWNLMQEGDQHRFFSCGGQMVKLDRRPRPALDRTTRAVR